MEIEEFVNQKYDPFNKNNILITKEEVCNLLNKFGIHKKPFEITNLNDFQTAFTHKSYSLKKFKEANVQIDENNEKAPDLQYDDYEVLEFLGDRVFDLAVVNYLVQRYPQQNQGFMTSLKHRIVSGEFMSDKYAQLLNFNKWILMSRHVEHKEGRHNEKIIEDIFEAFMGACFRLLSYNLCEKIVWFILENTLDFADLILNDTNYKDMIVKYFKINKKGEVIFNEISSTGPIHDRIITVELVDNKGNVISTGTEKTRKKAEQTASHRALVKYGVLSN